MINYDEMSHDEIIKRLKKISEENEKLRKVSSSSRKSQIIRLIEQGYNTIESISEELEITSKNVSSYLTYFRKDLEAKGKTIVSKRINNYTYISVIDFETLGWNT